MIQQEEAIVRLGLNTDPLKTGLQKAEAYVEKFGHKMETKFNKLLAVNVWHEALNLATEFGKYLQESLLNDFYHLDEGASRALENMREHFSKLRIEVNKTREEYEKVFTAGIFRRADDQEKMVILREQELENARKQVEVQKYLDDLARNRHNVGLAGDPHREESIAQYIAQQGEKKKELNQLLIEGEKIQERIEDVEKRIAEKKARDLDEQKRKEEQLRRQREQADKERERAIAELQRQLDSQNERTRRHLESFMPTIKELANAGQFVRGSWSGRMLWQGSPFGGDARQIMNLEERAKNQFIYGNVAGAKSSIAERDRLYDALAEAGIVPQRAEKAAEAQIETARILREGRTTTGALRTAIELEE